MYFVITFIFEFRLLLIVWRFQNIQVFTQGDQAVRRALVTFYIKLYLFVLLGFIFIEKILYVDWMLFAFNLPIWIPQIVKNFVYRSRQTPRIGFAIGLSLTQGLFPIYLRGYSQNVFEIEPHYLTVVIFIVLFILQILFMYMQQRKGARFFLPKKWWRAGIYDYERYFEDHEL